MTNLLHSKTPQTLLDALQHAASRKMTAEEIFEQQVSFVYGSLDDKSGVSRDQVLQVLMEHEGRTGTHTQSTTA